jgi:lipopolysaccharide transport system ATP-binding protein
LREPSEDEVIWALRDVSFTVDHGEVVGIIGRNGAGKSTLLKLLSRITEPTYGSAVLRGRVGSLLEVGTGFHPELTGRENIYLSGAILGMKRVEVGSKFDEIAAFSEVEKFLDTPVKRYSSGMYVRLAFAVAAHLEPEILLVDEVLAVGDAAFQRKCLGKMGDVATQGRTVLFVSHNMVAIQNLCQKAILLRDGRIAAQGPSQDVVSAYLSSIRQAQTEQVWEDQGRAPGNDRVRIRRVAIRPQGGEPHDPISMDTAFTVEVDYWNLMPESELHVCLHFMTEHQVVAFTSASNERQPKGVANPLPKGLIRSICNVPGGLLNEGTYRIHLLALRDTSKITFRLDEALTFDVLDMGTRPGTWYGREPGVVRPRLVWNTQVDGGPFR